MLFVCMDPHIGLGVLGVEGELSVRVLKYPREKQTKVAQRCLQVSCGQQMKELLQVFIPVPSFLFMSKKLK